MSDIYVFSGIEDDNDYSTLGLVGALTPTECVFKEMANGESAIEMSHPKDDFGRYLALQEGNILVVPVPMFIPPEIDGTTVVTTVYKYKVRSQAEYSGKKYRSVWKTKNVKNKEKPKKVLNPGDTVIVTWKPSEEGSEESRWKVKYVSKGVYAEGWMWGDGLEDKVEILIGNNSQSIQDVFSSWSIGEQLFRIYSVNKTLTDVRVQARHISYDLLYNMTDYESGGTASLDVAIKGVLSRTYSEHGFTASTNVGNEQTGLYYRGTNPIDAFLNLETGICTKFNVSMVRDNYDLYFLNDPGVNRGITLSYGKNLTGIDFTVTNDEMVTHVVPVGETENGKDLYLVDDNQPLAGRCVVSPRYTANPSAFPYPKYYKLECDNAKVGSSNNISGKTTKENARNRMRAAAVALFNNDEIDQPKVEMRVEFLNLGDTVEYEQFRGLENCFLFDYVIVKYGAMDINVTARIVSIEWDCLLDRMKSVEIGSVGKTLANTGITTWQIPSGFSGAKIANETIPGSALMSDTVNARHIQAGSINTAALQAHSVTTDILAAGLIETESISAVTGHINTITSDTIETDTLAAAMANLMNVFANNIRTGSITTDTFAAAMARIGVFTAGTARFDAASVRNLVAEAMSLSFGTANDVFIDNLRVAYAQIVSAAIGNLCIKASDGKYYTIDVSGGGLVTATETTVTQQEIDAGKTNAGRVILGTDITAETLSTSTLLATYALVNQIDAARIDVDQLVARQAFISKLNTNLIENNQIIQMVVDGAVEGLEIGGRNLVIHTLRPDVSSAENRPRFIGQQTDTSGRGTASVAEHGFRMTVSASSVNYPFIAFGTTANSSMNMNGLIPGQAYTFSVDVSWKVLSNNGELGEDASYTMQAAFRAKHDGASGFSTIETKAIATVTKADMGTEMSGRCELTFVVPLDAVATYISVQCGSTIGPYTAAGDYIELRNIKLETGTKATAWTPAPEDVDTGITTAQSTADAAQSSVDGLEIGGRNLLMHTARPESDDVVLQRATLSEGLIVITPTTSAAYGLYKTGLTLGELRGQKLIFSFDAREIAGTAGYGSGNMNVYCALQKPARIGNIPSSANEAYGRLYLAPQTGWGRYSMEITVPETLSYGNQTILTDTDADSLIFVVYVGRSARTCPIETRHWKLEKGDKATDWTEAPEDVAADIQAVQDATDSVDAEVSELSSKFEQTAEGFTLALSKKADSDTIHQWARYENGALELGDSTSEYVTRQDNTSWRVMHGGQVMTQIVKNTVSAPVIEAGRIVHIGSCTIKVGVKGDLLFN